MCVAIIVPEGKDPPGLDILKACEKANGDGGGIAWTEKGKLHFQKGINAEKIHSIVKDKKGPIFIHFRISTVGGKDHSLCHPFPVDRDAPLTLHGRAESVLMHNGHWQNWAESLLLNGAEYIPGPPWSDTRAMAYLCELYGSESVLKELIPKYQRVAVLHRDGTIEKIGDWDEKDGCLYSNLHWDYSPLWLDQRYFSKRERRTMSRRYLTPDWPALIDGPDTTQLEDEWEEWQRQENLNRYSSHWTDDLVELEIEPETPESLLLKKEGR